MMGILYESSRFFFYMGVIFFGEVLDKVVLIGSMSQYVWSCGKTCFMQEGNATSKICSKIFSDRPHY